MRVLLGCAAAAVFMLVLIAFVPVEWEHWRMKRRKREEETQEEDQG